MRVSAAHSLSLTAGFPESVSQPRWLASLIYTLLLLVNAEEHVRHTLETGKWGTMFHDILIKKDRPWHLYKSYGVCSKEKMLSIPKELHDSQSPFPIISSGPQGVLHKGTVTVWEDQVAGSKKYLSSHFFRKNRTCRAALGSACSSADLATLLLLLSRWDGGISRWFRIRSPWFSSLPGQYLAERLRKLTYLLWALVSSLKKEWCENNIPRMNTHAFSGNKTKLFWGKMSSTVFNI